jgi:hypothetical protein
MVTVVDRVRGSGLRALVTGRCRLGARSPEQSRRARGTKTRSPARTARLWGAGTAIGFGFGAAPANAADRTAATAAQASVGTLPLLAAMGIGIAVAVIAVIAFLQMTTKAKNAQDEAEEAFDEAEGDPVRSGPEPLGAKANAANPRNTLPEYTVPLPPVPDRPEAALPAEKGCPSLWGLEGEFAGSGFKVSDRWLTLGRDAAQCGLLFPYDASEVSRKHCSLKYEEERGLFLLEDHHSSNGTFLSGGERLEPGLIYELQPGSRFALSGSKHWFEVQV